MAWQPVSSWKVAGEKPKVCILDEIGCDGRPFVHTIIAETCKRADGPFVVLLSLECPLGEYVSTGRRLGHDLNLASIQTRFASICCFADESLDLTTADAADVMVQRVQSLKSTRPVFIVLEGLHILPSLGWSLFSIMTFVKRLEDISERICIRANRQTCHGVALSRWLANRSDTVISVQKLQSGTSRIAHGEVLFHSNERTLAALFKCTDSAVLVQPKPANGNYKIKI
ncbi:hypothetical protein PSACC_00331 [Paramicrosporidium saccamoebae]|uniref:Elongator complex protein 6 n=1 Tax=Paramicrosporidium saccamoebae TaxID=1246581 RepID=A0A2H9TQ35_9FUNG|nr:hypothetical protein PSACC_00331 [Paramicrosporidium saccamoebae]